MRIRTFVGATLTAAALSVGGLATTAAMADTTVSAGGGTFRYGVGDGPKGAAYTFSYYLHNTKTHNATVCGAADISCSSTAWVSKGVWAKKDVLKYAFGNRALYNTK